MRNQEIAEHLVGDDATLATNVKAPITEMKPKWLRSVGFSDTAIGTIQSLDGDEPWRLLTQVDGIGPETAKKLYHTYDIKNVPQLKESLKTDPLPTIDNIDHIRKAVQWVGEGRIALEDAHDIVDSIYAHIGDQFSRLKAVGSYRRRKNTVGDIDMLGIHDTHMSTLHKSFKAMCDYVIRCGERKMTGRAFGTQVDIQIVTEEEWPAALQYFTGSQDHNIDLRKAAKVDDLKLNEYGLFDRTTEERIPISSERELYEYLLGEYIEPENRT